MIYDLHTPSFPMSTHNRNTVVLRATLTQSSLCTYSHVTQNCSISNTYLSAFPSSPMVWSYSCPPKQWLTYPHMYHTTTQHYIAPHTVHANNTVPSPSKISHLYKTHIKLVAYLRICSSLPFPLHRSPTYLLHASHIRTPSHQIHKQPPHQPLPSHLISSSDPTVSRSHVRR